MTLAIGFRLVASLLDDISGIAQNYAEAVTRVVSGWFCYSIPILVGNPLRLPATDIIAGVWSNMHQQVCENGDSGTVPQLPFRGGQCPVRYFITTEINEFNSLEGLWAEPSWVGPLTSIQWDIVQVANGFNFYVPTVTGVNGSFQGSASFRYAIPIGASQDVPFNLLRHDGLPDDCGDPGSTIPSPFPDPGFPPGGPIVYPPGGGPVVVDIDIGNGATIAVPIQVGPFDIPVEFNFPIELNIDNHVWQILPDFTLAPRFNVGGGGGASEADLAELNAKLDALKDVTDQNLVRTAAVEQAVFMEVSAQLTSGQCGDESPSSVEVTGNAFEFLAAVMTQESLGRYVQSRSLCPVLGPRFPDVEASVIASGTAGINHAEFVQVSDDVLQVALRCDGLPVGLRVYRNAGEDIHAKFGFIAEALDMGSNPCPKEQEYVYTREHLLDLSRFDERTRYVRIALAEGIQWTLTDTGVR